MPGDNWYNLCFPSSILPTKPVSPVILDWSRLPCNFIYKLLTAWLIDLARYGDSAFPMADDFQFQPYSTLLHAAYFCLLPIYLVLAMVGIY